MARTNREVGRRTGWAIQRSPSVGSLDAELVRLLQQWSIDNVIDVGAHIGGFAMNLRRLGFTGTITSFEPFPDSFTALEARAASDEAWSVRQIALAEREGEMKLQAFTGDGQFNSLRELSSHARTYSSKLASTGTVVVPVRRLDSMWPSEGTDLARTMLKTDTQGYELEVLAGAGDLLADIPVVLMEVAVKALYEGAPVMHEVMSAMAGWGFEPTGAFPIHRYGRGRVIEFDCTFINTARL